MRLFSKYNRINITATIVIFLAGSCTFYFLLRYILIHQVDESLETEQQEIVRHVADHNKLPHIFNTEDQHIEFIPVTSFVTTHFSSNTETYSGKKEPYRQLQFGISAAGKNYLAIVGKPLEETEDLLQIIISVTVGMIALILLAGYLINRRILGKIWSPFYQTISRVRSYDIAQQDVAALPPTNIDEFSLLNDSINAFIERIQKDYRSLKDFTGQAAHEMQTPLAIIRSKLDILIQDENFIKYNQQTLADIEAAVLRLSRLYQSLLLLTKIENRQFQLNEQVALDKILEDKLHYIAELTDEKNIQLNTDISPATIHFHHHLAEIIIDNLLRNAVRYNVVNGEIDIYLNNWELSIANTSYLPALDTNKIFNRFYRHGDVKSDGTGLGLSIVKQICDLAGYLVNYQYQQGKHIFTIHLK